MRKVVLAAIVAAAGPWSAYGSNNTGLRWTPYQYNGYKYYIKWKFDTTFPENSSMRGYIQYGSLAWNSVGRELHFNKNQSHTAATGLRVAVRYNDLWFPVHDKLAVALTNWCGGDPSGICVGEITFNKSPNGWKHYWGQAPLACPYVDIWSTSAHEFGHLVELHHSSPFEDTMYDTIHCGNTSQRSLTAHDKAGIEEMYAAH